MAGQCKKEGCYPHIRCEVGEMHKKDCKHWVNGTEEKSADDGPSEENAYLLTWSGNSMGLDDIPILSERSNPLLIGLIGAENSGKTTFLGLLYLLLNNGQFISRWDFSHSYTVLGWEYIANYLRYEAGIKPEFPPHTSSFDGRDVGLLHLGLYNRSNLKDIVLTDVPGEWFTNWSIDINDKNAGSAPWIHKNSRGFFFLIDCAGLSEEPGKFRINTIKLIRRISNDLHGRPVAVLWSKADKFDTVNSSAKEIICKELEKFKNYKEFRISVYKDNSNTFHEEILNVFGWLLDNIKGRSPNNYIEIPVLDSSDLFISYRGNK